MEDPSLDPQVNMYSRYILSTVHIFLLKSCQRVRKDIGYRWRWAHWRSLFTPDIFGPHLFQIVKGKRRGEMPLFMWKAHCTKSPAVQSRRERIWRRVFLNPRETSKGVLSGGQPRRYGGTPYKKKTSQADEPARTALPLMSQAYLWTHNSFFKRSCPNAIFCTAGTETEL